MINKRYHKTAFLAPRLPPYIDGVGDYSANLIRNSPELQDALLLVYEGGLDLLSNFPRLKIESIPSDLHDLDSLLFEADVSLLIVQYSAYGFHSRGCPLALLKAVRRWRLSNRENRLLIMAHELWTRSVPWRLDGIRQLLHRRECLKLACSADYIFTSTSGYQAWLSSIVPPSKLRTLPIGSNIIPLEPFPLFNDRETGGWVLFGKQRSRIRALESFRSWIPKLYAAGLIDKLEIVGSAESSVDDEHEMRLLTELLPREVFVRHGELNVSDLSRVLARNRYGLLSQTPQSSTKSGVFMAYASHQLAVVVSQNWKSSVPFGQWVIEPSSLFTLDTSQTQIAIAVRSLFDWYTQNASWPTIAEVYRSVIAQISL
jgi:hypothetical protein